MRYRKNSRHTQGGPPTLQALAQSTVFEHRNSVSKFVHDLKTPRNLTIKKPQSKIERYCWKVCFTICMLILFRFCAILVIKYCTYGTHLSMENSLTPNLTFPAVTICNNGKYFNTTHMNRDDILRSWAIDEAFTVNDDDLLSEDDLKNSWFLKNAKKTRIFCSIFDCFDQFLKYFSEPGETYKETFHKVWRGDAMVPSETGQNVVAGYPLAFYNKTFTKFMDVWGYNLTDDKEIERGITLIHAKFGGAKIRATNRTSAQRYQIGTYPNARDIPFRRIYTELGVCYTWNMFSKFRNQKPTSTNNIGSDSGLRLVLNINHSNYVYDAMTRCQIYVVKLSANPELITWLFLCIRAFLGIRRN